MSYENPLFRKTIDSKREHLSLQLGNANPERNKIRFVQYIDSLETKGEIWMKSYSPITYVNYNRRKNMRPFLCCEVPDDVESEDVKLYIENEMGGYTDGSKYAQFLIYPMTKTTAKEDISSPIIRSIDKGATQEKQVDSSSQVNVLLIEFTSTSRAIKNSLFFKGKDPKVRIMITNPREERHQLQMNAGDASSFYRMWTRPFIIRGGSDAQRNVNRTRKRKVAENNGGGETNETKKFKTNRDMLVAIFKEVRSINERLAKLENIYF